MTRKTPGARTARGRRALLQPLAVAALLCLATAAAAHAQRAPHYYTVRQAVLPDNSSTQFLLNITGIDDRGRAIGNDGSFAWLWEPGGLSRLGPINVSSSAHDINAAGAIVGALGQGAQRLGLGLSQLSPPGSSGVAFGISASGWAVGANTTIGNPQGPSLAAIWSPGGDMSFLPGGSSWNPLAVNDQQTVVGWGTSGAMMWTPGGGLQSISNSPLRMATKVNDLGHVLIEDRLQGWRMDSGGVLTPLQAAGGAEGIIVHDMNGLGQVVGAMSFRQVAQNGVPRESRTTIAFWDEPASGRFQPVDIAAIARLDVGTLADRHYDRLQAMAINDRGQIAVSAGRYSRINGPGGPIDVTAPIEHFILTPCVRCGQLKPNPNVGALNVGPDWVDAYNERIYVNQGLLIVGTTVVNRQVGGDLFNRPGTGGEFTIEGTGLFDNEGRFQNDDGALRVQGSFLNRAGARLSNSSFIGVNATGTLDSRGQWENGPGSIVAIDGRVALAGGNFGDGTLFRDSRLIVRGGLSVTDSVLSLEGSAASVNGAGRIDVFSGLLLAGHWTNAQGARSLSVIDVTGPQAGLGVGAAAGLTLNEANLVVQTGANMVSAGQVNLTGGSSLVVQGSASSLRNRAGGVLSVDGQSGLQVLDGASFTNTGVVQQRGLASVSGGASIVTGGPGLDSWINQGRLLLSGGASISTEAVDPGGWSLLNRPGGLISLEAGTALNNAGYFLNQGSVTMHLGATLRNDGIFLLGAAGTIEGQGSFEQQAASASTRIDGSARFDSFSVGAGILSGSGTVRARTVALGAGIGAPTLGILPGNSPGTLRFVGDVVLDNVDIEIEAGPFGQVDTLAIDGNLEVRSATLRFAGGAGWAPDLNDRFGLVASGSVTGVENISFAAQALPGGWTTQLDSDGAITVWNDAAFELPDAPPPNAFVGVAAGEIAYLGAARSAAGYAISSLQIEGSLALQRGAQLQVVDNLTLSPAGRLSSRGLLQTDGVVSNNGGFVQVHREGRFVASAGSGFFNEGRLVVDGQFDNRGLFSNAAGAHTEVNGLFQSAAGSALTNQGTLVVGGRLASVVPLYNLGGQVQLRAGARIELLSDAAGQPAFFEQQGDSAVLRLDGVMVAPQLRIQGGALEGSGQLEGIAFLGGAGTPVAVLPGGARAIGTLRLGSAIATDTAFAIDIAGIAELDQLAIANSFVASGGRVDFLFLDGWQPAPGARFSWLQAANPQAVFGLDGLAWSVGLVRADGSVWLMDGSAGADPAAPLRFAFDGTTLAVTAVPEPGTWATLAAGLLWLAWRRRTAQAG